MAPVADISFSFRVPLPIDAGSFIWNITRFYENAYHHIGGFEDGMPLHDPSAVMMFLHPQMLGKTKQV